MKCFIFLACLIALPPDEPSARKVYPPQNAIVIMSFVHATLSARADVYWNGGSSSVWLTAANWSGDVMVGNASANGALNMISGGG